MTKELQNLKSYQIHPKLEGAYYLHDIIPKIFLEKLKNIFLETPGDPCSVNMYATRHWLTSREIADQLLKFLPQDLGYTRILSDLRFISYPLGGFIAPHVDGIRVDPEYFRNSTTSFLLFLNTTLEGEGETEFLVSLDSEEVVTSIRPMWGSILVFPHCIPHRGQCVGSGGKLLLRGDLY